MADLLRLMIALASRVFLFCLLPFIRIRPGRVLFQSYREKQYSCNPKYVSEALLRLRPKGLEVAWSFREPEKFAYLEKEGVRVLKAGSLRAVLYALSAQVVCVNTYYKPTLPRRKGQMQMRTWHGGGAYKRVALMEKMNPVRRESLRLQLSGATLYLSSSKAFTQQTIRESFGFTGEVLNCGMPRNDLLINGAGAARLQEIRKNAGLPEGARLALYAPTYRAQLKTDMHALDTEALTKALEARFGGKWLVAYRGHVFVREGRVNVPDLSAYPDMQELLLIADALITDYSSSMWDMSLTGKPVFLYCPDLDEYVSSRDFYTDIRTWPYPLAQSNEALCAQVRAFDEEKYKEALRRHHEALGSCETGQASRTAAQRILDEIDRVKS